MEFKVMLAVQEQFFGQLLGSFLEQSGLTVLGMSLHCVELYDWMQEVPSPADILLVDDCLPPYGGRQAAEQLLEINPRLRAIVMGGGDGPPVIKDRRIGFISRHLSCDEVLCSLQSALQGNRVIARRTPEQCMETSPQYRRRILTPRQRDVLSLLVHGMHTKEIADKLDISPSTVETHRKHIREKTGISSPFALARFAERYGLLNREHGGEDYSIDIASTGH